jgi:hypothetical protein
VSRSQLGRPGPLTGWLHDGPHAARCDRSNIVSVLIARHLARGFVERRLLPRYPVLQAARCVHRSGHTRHTVFEWHLRRCPRCALTRCDVAASSCSTCANDEPLKTVLLIRGSMVPLAVKNYGACGALSPGRC